MAVEEGTGAWTDEELTEETWLSEINIEKAKKGTILESNTIMEALQEAIEEHQAGVEDAIKEASVPFPSCGQGGACTRAGLTDAVVQDLTGNDDSVMAGGAQSSAPAVTIIRLEVTTEAIPVDLVAGKEAIGFHGIPPAWATETAAELKMAQLEHTAEMQQADPEWLRALYCKIDEDGRERQGTILRTSLTPESLGHSQGSMTPGQQALHVARQCIQSSSMHTDAETSQVVRTLAVALGASRPEAGTIKALRAVVMLLERPEMSEEEAYTSTGASMSNFKRWRKRVQSAQLGVSLP